MNDEPERYDRRPRSVHELDEERDEQQRKENAAAVDDRGKPRSAG